MTTRSPSAAVDVGRAEPVLAAHKARVLAALLGAPTITAAAKAAGVGERTLRRWLAEPAFRDAYAAARREAMQQASARLQDSAFAAVETLRQLAADENVPASARVAAARAILEQAARAAETEDLGARVARLERQQTEEPWH